MNAEVRSGAYEAYYSFIAVLNLPLRIVRPLNRRRYKPRSLAYTDCALSLAIFLVHVYPIFNADDQRRASALTIFIIRTETISVSFSKHHENIPYSLSVEFKTGA